MKTQLTAEESAKLIELGVSPERASERTPDYTDINNTGKPLERRELLPIFTLADILDMLPREVKCEDLEIGFCGEDWCAGYGEITFFHAPELIDALYLLLGWCLVRGHVKLD